MRERRKACYLMTIVLHSATAFFVGINVHNNPQYGSSGRHRSPLKMTAEGSRITMPALSSTMKEGKIISWLKSEGDPVSAGEPIMVVESDKADMDVEAFEDGYLAKIVIGEGEIAPVGDLVALIASEENEIDEVASQLSTKETTSNDVPASESVAAAASYSVDTTEIYMPALSSTMVEGKIISWLKSPGDEVKSGEPIIVVESDKADMDVEAFEDGFLAAILKEEGETAEVGAPIGIIVENESDVAVVQSGPKVQSSATPSPTTSSDKPNVDFTQLDMPALSSTMKEGKIISWLKSEGDPVSAGEPIMVVESDKADMDVEAFEDGYLAAILTEEGESGAVGAPVALIAENEADIPTLKAYAASLSSSVASIPSTPSPAPSPLAKVSAPSTSATSSGGRVIASPLAKKLAKDIGVDISTVKGTGPNGRVTASDVEAASKSAPVSSGAKDAAPAQPQHIPLPGVVAATPMAREAAKKAKLNLSSIQGTGSFGRVTLDDVKLATGEKKPPKKTVLSGAPLIEMPDGFVPFTGMQRGVSNNMEATLSTPVFRCTREIEMDKFDALYQKLKKDGVSVSSLLARAIGLAIQKHPIINSSYKEGGTQFNPDINIAMAVAIDGGLITPTLRNADEKSISELGTEWRELVQKAKSNSLSPEEYTTGTFVVSNLGMFGISQFDAILPKGTGSILAVGATKPTVVPDSQAVMGLKIVKKMAVTLTCDHRQIYGADAALFLKTLADIMENKIDSL